MTQEDKVSIKLEVLRDSSTGKLKIMAHFDVKASNVFIDKNEYVWMPTIEERNLLNEAFKFIPSESYTSEPTSTITQGKEIEMPELEKEPEPVKSEEPPIEVKSVFDEPKKENITYEKEEPAVFEVTKEDSPEPKPDKEIEKPVQDMDAKVEVKPTEETTESEESKEEIEEDEGIIVEADADAIEAALKKHTGKNDDLDDSMVEADEKTIVDKVLSQKKKGKWSKK